LVQRSELLPIFWAALGRKIPIAVFGGADPFGLKQAGLRSWKRTMMVEFLEETPHLPRVTVSRYLR
jgi:hypothetical protein